MCGIAGILDFTGATPSRRQIEAMTWHQRHRGPDGQGILQRDGVAFGHRRLSIIDVQGGQQPMTNETGDIWLTFNGEIYNYQDLRQALISAGHVFRTQSDSEVIVHAYEQWGDACVQRLRGMFAFAIADFRERRVLLARDHLGIKPLYYRLGRNSLAFASELSALTCRAGESLTIRAQAIDYYLRYRYIPAPHTIYEEILRLPPAHVWSCHMDGRVDGLYEYWRLQMRPEASRTDEEWLERFETILEESVAAHLVSDVPFGAFLSGGIDSTLIVAAMARQLDRPVQAFSIGFEDRGYSEVDFAQQAARRLGVNLHTATIRPDVVTILDDLFSHYGEPFADTSAVPTWCVAQLARQHVPMVLSGDGADEAFAGYTRYEHFVRDNAWRDAASILRCPKRGLRQLLARVIGTYPSRLERWQQRHIGVFDASARRRLWRPEFQSLVETPCSAFTSAHRRAASLAPLEYAQYVDLKTYLPGDILMKVDVASMCHGLEVRTPFTDVNVIEFAATLPHRWRRTQRSLREGVLKPLPKSYLARQFPDTFVHRRKQGFAIPEADWLKQGSPIRDRMDAVLDASSSLLYEYFEPQHVRQLVQEFDSQRRHATSLWLLMILGMWMERRSASPRLELAA